MHQQGKLCYNEQLLMLTIGIPLKKWLTDGKEAHNSKTDDHFIIIDSNQSTSLRPESKKNNS